MSAEFLIGVSLVGLVILTAAVSFAWTPYDPELVDAARKLLAPGDGSLLGADKFGRDVASRLMVGARTTLYVGVVAVGIAGLAGIPLGVLAGMTQHRWLAGLIMRGNDLLFAFPALLLAVMLSAVYGSSTATAMAAIGIATIPAFSRIARVATLRVMVTEYVLAARSAGRGTFGIALRHVLPNIGNVLIVQASVSFSIAILAEAALSFLGFGTRPPTPSWGRMLQESQELLFTEPRLALWPGLAIAASVLGFSLLGDGLRDLLDPKLHVGGSPRTAGRRKVRHPEKAGSWNDQNVNQEGDSGGDTARDEQPQHDSRALLSVVDLSVSAGSVPLVRGISFAIGQGERVGLIGESGSGKSLTAQSLLGLLPEDVDATGSVRLAGVGHELMGASERKLAEVRGKRASMVFQEPMTALNPVMRISQQVGEVMSIHGTRATRAEVDSATIQLLDKVGLDGLDRAYPHQLSGGQRQRVMLAIAMANDPALLICDEPTTALDVSTQRNVLDLVRSLSVQGGAALLFVSHDLAVVSWLCQRVLVMYGGQIVECGPVDEVISAPKHPYTQGLLSASDMATEEGSRRLRTIPGTVPDAGALPEGCAFRGRCDVETSRCATAPVLRGTEHSVACWHPREPVDV